MAGLVLAIHAAPPSPPAVAPTATEAQEDEVPLKD
jgi:hypothetical protein